MEKAIEALISGDLNTASLLMLFIVGMLTKRFVPWWVYEEVLDKLEDYENTAPSLLTEVKRLNTLLNDPNVYDVIGQNSSEVSQESLEKSSITLQETLSHRKPTRRRRNRVTT